ncbi:beta-N-acetylglucosaminidase domain-containing protein [Micromonospora sp. DR5-3]|uniref:beta-N-acetylglucosaminidase domain-containing protein n=1 Tax=unclassified Micromonospora TaxID=2617518 RepID=UPI0011D36D07|nr:MULTISPECIES: beta-N-acetylglucosaminidase domain-containing protein [unclassified Micromonospora]MCW3815994.1 beta-N-acetylglucosaminidase domain-containing protein [Micromonospora sp. DR5-3]TYC20009.1 hyaluronidase [Micromonospora sp. MP36]
MRSQPAGPGRCRVPGALLATSVLLMLTAMPASARGDERIAAELPVVSPAPQQMSRAGADVVVPGKVEVVVGDDTDAAARDLLVGSLKQHGVDRVDVVLTASRHAALTVHLGAAARADIAEALGSTPAPAHPEGYALRVSREVPLGTVGLGGVDPAGQYYAVQSLRQLFLPGDDGGWRLAGAQISDFPSMPLRGTIEGFYGPPWTHDERLDQLAFYGDVKANTYVYAPKDDPYHRERWREPYPAAKLAQLQQLVDQATRHHVRFTFALSPGNTICYSGDADRQALVRKFQAMYDIGVRAFSVPLDDISLRFNCDDDRVRYGTASQASVGRAQAELLNYLQREFVGTRDGVRPLQTVPTQYGDLSETPYKRSWRSDLVAEVVVMWTGTDVVPPSITNDQARRISELYGREVFVWDNYPVNDYGNTRGRLLLAPYAKREAGLSDHLAGIVANPMNQAAGSKVAVFGVADFTWNDRAYDAGRNWREAMRYLTGDDPVATEALLVFGDLNHLAPTFGTTPWQPQAPALRAKLAEFWRVWEAGDRHGAIAALRGYADAIAGAPDVIRAGAVVEGFVADATPWLDATGLWGDAFVATLDALAAQLAGDGDKARRLLETAEDLVDQASAVRVDPPDNSWGRAPVKVADGVLDTFLPAAWDLVREPIQARVPATVVFDDSGIATLPVEVTNRTAGSATAVTVQLQVSDGGTVEPRTVELGDVATGETRRVDARLSWPGDRTARAATVTSTVSWQAGRTQRVTQELPVQVTCASSPTRPAAVTSVDSEETAGENGAGANAIDGDPGTFWHTAWSASNPPPPHEIQLDLGRMMDVCALRYLPRQDTDNGRISRYEVYLSQDGKTWANPVATGQFNSDAKQKWVPLANTTARYVRFVALAEVQGRPWTTAAEISVDAVPH